jgi:hypothetical protein|tara:strand:+ start:529 stop:684 length:156 start_codon:yes stop_codon:yes gene_type:complete
MEVILLEVLSLANEYTPSEKKRRVLTYKVLNKVFQQLPTLKNTIIFCVKTL